MNGVLVIDKPAGPTSHDVVARLRQILKESKIGHTGTLDPMATGVLPLAIGQATRLVRFLTAGDKTYEADIRLGHSTDTYDATGTSVESSAGASIDGVTPDAVEAALSAFRGVYSQLPPPFSAKKIAGVRAHRLARRAQPVELAPVRVSVSHLTGQSLGNGLLRLHLTCSAGFYVRSLAHALGERLGTGAVLERLRRVRSGQFSLDQACLLPTSEDDRDAILARVIPMERLLTWLPGVTLTDADVRRASHGNSVEAHDAAVAALPRDGSVPVRLLDSTGALVAIAEPGEIPGTLRPRVVLV